MALQPTATNPIPPANNLDVLTTLIKQIPIGKVLQAQLVALEKSTQLIINQTKPIKLQLPVLSLPENTTAVTVQLIEKLPLLKLQLELTRVITDIKNPVQQTPTTNNSVTNNPIVNNAANNLKNLFEIILHAKLPAEIKALTQNNVTKTILQATQQVVATTTQNVIQQNIPVSEQTTPLLNKVLWPQHATLEKLSQTLIISKLAQLNTALPTQNRDPFVEVLQKWIKQLISTTSENRISPSNNSSANIPNSQTIDSATIRRAIANSGQLWESNLRRELGLNQSQDSKLPSTPSASLTTPVGLNIKAQLLRIIQSLPIVLTRIAPEIAARFISTETEVWQMVFKINQQLNLHAQNALPMPTSQLPPDFWMNWLEQNLKLITLWLRNVEQQQAELPQQPNQQTLLRLDLPVPTETDTEWLKLEIDEEEKQDKKSKQWKWQLRMSFDFGADKKLSTVTNINDKDLSVLFEGGQYFEKKMNSATLQQLADNLQDKTGLESSVEFNKNITDNIVQNNKKVHLEI